MGCVGCSVRMSFCCLAADKKTKSVFLEVEVINGTPASSFDCLTSRMIEHKLKESEEVKKLIIGVVGDWYMTVIHSVVQLLFTWPTMLGPRFQGPHCLHLHELGDTKVVDVYFC